MDKWGLLGKTEMYYFKINNYFIDKIRWTYLIWKGLCYQTLPKDIYNDMINENIDRYNLSVVLI